MKESTAKHSPPDPFPSGTRLCQRSFSSSGFTSAAATPFATSSSPRHFAVPFSWERRPGIPKSPKVAASTADAGEKLPLPPLFRSHSDLSTRYRGQYRSHGRLGLYADDPFVIALRNCIESVPAGTVDAGDDMRDGRQRKGEIAGRFGSGLRRLYGSCKSASSAATAEATVRVHRAGSDRGPVEVVRLNVSRAGVYPRPNY